MLLIHLLMSDIRKPTFLCENTLKANGEGGDKRVTRDSLNNMPFALNSKLYIPSTLNIDLILWRTQLIVCAVKY